MSASDEEVVSRLCLQTLGAPALVDAKGRAIHGIRRKDLALLIYLGLAGKKTYSRAQLADLLWGDRPEERGRHSLTQSLGRLQRHVGEGPIRVERNWVEWHDGLLCDALELEAAFREGTPWKTGLYVREFLADFDPGPGAEEFRSWADERRARYRTMMVQVLDRMGGEAERERRWSDALELAQRLVELEPIFEEGHRRLMRTWSAIGERALALHHYQRLSEWLKRELNESPDPATQLLAEDLRSHRSRGPPDDSRPSRSQGGEGRSTWR